MKRLVLFLLAIPFAGQAQSDSVQHLLRKSLWRVTFVQPGLAYELRLGRKTTLTSSANLTGQHTSESGINIPRVSRYGLGAQADAGFRYYYNLGHRLTTGKSIRYNSGNYLRFNTRYTSSPVVAWGDELTLTQLDNRERLAFQVLWGHQATLPSRFYADIAGGFEKVTHKTGLQPALLFRVGYTLSK